MSFLYYMQIYEKKEEPPNGQLLYITDYQSVVVIRLGRHYHVQSLNIE